LAFHHGYDYLPIGPSGESFSKSKISGIDYISIAVIGIISYFIIKKLK
jgi:hypothetical protein